uniref:DUF3719 domain-containing protein n=1 Tax=Mesocestoides corti TaxID=53468 RepID=A0A5K3FDY5_MESCO
MSKCTSLTNLKDQSLYTDFNATKNILKQPHRISSSPSLLATLFKENERKPNILNPRIESCISTSSHNLLMATASRPSFGGPLKITKKGRNPVPPPPTPRHIYFDLSTLPSDDCSFATNPNDLNSLTSSDWGDEACEIDRERSHHVQLLFDAIDQMLYQPDLFSESSQVGSVKEGIPDIKLVKHLMHECKEWAAKFPHFRIQGVHLKLPHERRSCQIYPNKLTEVSGDSAKPSLMARKTPRSPEVSRTIPSIPDSQNASYLRLPSSSLLVQGQQLLTPTPGDNVKWPNRSRIGRLTVPFKANNRQGNQLVHAAPQSRLNARSPRLNKPLSILLEEKPTISHDREMKRTQKNSKGSLCPATHGVLQHGSYGTVQSRTTADAIFGAQSPQKAIYMGSRAAELSETLSIADNHAVSYKEALSQALVELLLNDTLHALKNAEASKLLADNMSSTSKLPLTVSSNLIKSLPTLDPGVTERNSETHQTLTPIYFNSTKTPPPSQLRERSPNSNQNFLLSGRSCHPQMDGVGLAATGSSFGASITKLSDASGNTYSQNSHSEPTTGFPATNGRKSTVRTRHTLPPIAPSKTTPQIARQRSRTSSGVNWLPPLFPTTTALGNVCTGSDANFYYSTQLSLRGVNREAAVEHSSLLRGPKANETTPAPSHHALSVHQNQKCITKLSSCNTKTTQLQYSVSISSHRH